VEECTGGRVSGEETSVHYPETELFETAASWTPVMGDSGCRLFGDFWELAVFRKF